MARAAGAPGQQSEAGQRQQVHGPAGQVAGEHQREPERERGRAGDQSQIGGHGPENSASALGYPRAVRGWTRVRFQSLFRHRLFELRHEQLERPEEGRRREALVLDAPAWVNVVAVDGDGQVLLVRQWRFGIGAPTLEIPGGMVDPGETPLEAARRELLEETGYRAARWSELGAVEPNPAFLTNRCTTFLAEGLERVGEPVGDGEEEITVESAPVEALGGLVDSGAIRHSLVIAAFYLYERRRR